MPPGRLPAAGHRSYTFVPVGRAGPIVRRRCGIIGRVEGATQDGVCGLAEDWLPLLPQRRTGEPLTEQDADPPRAVTDLDVLRQVLAALRRLD
jgi:hypothetical protein